MWNKWREKTALKMRRSGQGVQPARTLALSPADMPFADLIAQLYDIPYTRTRRIAGNP